MNEAKGCIECGGLDASTDWDCWDSPDRPICRDCLRRRVVDSAAGEDMHGPRFSILRRWHTREHTAEISGFEWKPYSRKSEGETEKFDTRRAALAWGARWLRDQNYLHGQTELGIRWVVVQDGKPCVDCGNPNASRDWYGAERVVCWGCLKGADNG